MFEPNPASDQNASPDIEHDLSDDDEWAREDELERKQAKKRKRLLFVIGLVIGIPLMVVLGIAGLGLLYVYGAKELPVSASDRTVVLTAETLAEWFDGFTPEAKHASLVKVRNIDGSIAIEYEYEDSTKDDSPYIYCSTDYHGSVRDARLTAKTTWIGAKGGVSLLADGVTVEEKNDLFRWGDTSQFGNLVYAGEPCGHVFVCQQGKMVFFLSLGGVYFDGTESLKELLSDMLERAAAYDPKGD